MLNVVAVLIGQRRHVDGLSGTVDAAVGEEHDMALLAVVGVVAVAAVPANLLEAVVAVGIGEEIVNITLVDDLALLVTGQFKHIGNLVALDGDLHMRTGNGLSCGAVHHGDAALGARQLLAHDVEVADVEQALHRLRLGGGLQFHHIDAGLQSGHMERVAELLVGRMALVAVCLRQLGHEPLLEVLLLL